MVAVLLRAYIRIVEIGNIGIVQANQGSCLAVNIVLLRAASVVAHIGIVSRQPETQSKSRKTRRTSRAGGEAAQNLHGP